MTNVPKGMYVPIVTPFNDDQTPNWEKFKKVIDFTIDSGIDGMLIAGSTGEYHMMTTDEHKEVLAKGLEFVAGRIPTIAGIGKSTPSATIDMARFAAEHGADFGLVLPPYYQPTTRQGVIDFFTEIADNSPIGIVIYNNPFSTCVELEPELVFELAQHPNIVSIKDTSDMIHTCQCIALTRHMEDFTVFQGYEHTILPALAAGADGGFAILMNALPKEYVKLYQLTKENRWAEAADFNMSMADLYTAMEAEPYPAPVKAAMELIGIPGGCVRKPLVNASDELIAKMKKALVELGYKL